MRLFEFLVFFWLTRKMMLIGEEFFLIFGLQVDRLIQTGLYRFSRNPQIVFGLSLSQAAARILAGW
jgi:hypothetical protein